MVQGTDAPTGKRGDTTSKNSNTSVGSATHVDICAVVSGVVKPFFRRGRGCTSLPDMVNNLLCCLSCKWNPPSTLHCIGCSVLVITLLPLDGYGPKRNKARVTPNYKRSNRLVIQEEVREVSNPLSLARTVAIVYLSLFYADRTCTSDEEGCLLYQVVTFSYAFAGCSLLLLMKKLSPAFVWIEKRTATNRFASSSICSKLVQASSFHKKGRNGSIHLLQVSYR